MKVTVVGGGFGGVKSALELAKDPDVQVTLISNNRKFQYYPTLYSTATGHDHRESWVDLELIFKDYRNIKLVQDTITTIDPATKVVVGENKTRYSYQNLILALGSVTTYFGIEDLEAFSYGIKSEEEIRKLQKHLFDQMRNEKIIEKHYVIIGGGPTGVELAGALGEYIERLRKYFRLPQKKIHIDLIEASPRILPRSHPETSKRAAAQLKKLGVNVECGKVVQRQTADTLTVSGKPIKTHTVIWTSGVANAPFFKQNAEHFKLDQRNHVIVNDYLQARANIYVIGDNAATQYAGLAQTALHNGAFVARNLLRKKNGRRMRKYHPARPSSVIPVGHKWAAFEFGKIRFYGGPAVFMRDAADLIGFHDLLPFGRAIDTWQAGARPELRIPEDF